MSGGWTKGVWAIHSRYGRCNVSAPNGRSICSTGGYSSNAQDSGVIRAENEANAALIAEAGTVANETGLSPRQLADQRAELLAALDEICQEFAQQHPLIKKGRDIIAKATAS
jgi:hypothetical protein